MDGVCRERRDFANSVSASAGGRLLSLADATGITVDRANSGLSSALPSYQSKPFTT